MLALTSPDDQPFPHRNPPRDHHLPARYCPSANTTYSPEFSSFIFALHSLHESKSYSEVVKSPEWQHAMNEKLVAFQRTHTRNLVPLSPGANPVSFKWIYRIKTKYDGFVE